MNDIDTLDRPRAFGVPHNEWRFAQKEAFLMTRGFRIDIENAIREGRADEIEKHFFLELPTGSGKSGIATALGAEDQVLVVVHTLGLLDQYEAEYGFSIIKGKQEYICADEEKIEEWREEKIIPTAADCHHGKMTECSFFEDCPYLIARNKAIHAQRAACTYRYAALSPSMQGRGGIVVLDEAHSAIEELISFAEFQIKEKRRVKFNLPPFPDEFEFGYGDHGLGGVVNESAFAIISNWFEDAIRATYREPDKYYSEEGTKIKRLHDSLTRTYQSLIDTPYFLKCGNNVGSESQRVGPGRFKTVATPALILQALDASPIAYKLWSKKKMAVLMSATIGKAETLATPLGIDQFRSETFAHPVPKKFRPIFNLQMSKMTAGQLKKNPSLYRIQGRIIRKFIERLPQDWRGVILTSSFKKIQMLSEYLIQYFPERIHDPYRKIPQGERILAFLSNPQPGLITVETMQGWGQGLNFYGDLARFIIVAGIPFDNPSDKYVTARRQQPGGGNYYLYRAYNTIPQATGRVSRGEILPDGEFMVNVAAIADGSGVSKRAFDFFPPWFADAIQDGLPENGSFN